ncbi:FKBP12-associated protein 1-like protein [Colletotrichum chlorophyti]|uniref:FKBP12-associated protein 1-like protein n=1 Tax=Colletotrichum chlorophyti TaxID=708187 RepID=A0A1Q8RVZ9_9PEZI|nr:FKBP12-associated protein 1-like protein [Colletotrichum chlorophyti]
MSEIDVAPAQTQVQTQASSSNRGGSQSGRRGRSGRGRGDRGQGNGGRRGGSGRNASAQQPQNQPQPTPALGNVPENATSESAPSSSGRRGRGRGGSRGGRRVAAGRGGPVSGTHRTFGGHLTTGANADDGATASLSADASEFVPGQPVVPRGGKQAPKQRKPQYPLAPKSTAEDLPTRIHEDINNGQYECVICSSEVLRPSRVWSCGLCWTVLHLSCVKKWFTSQLKKDDETRSWRCPGCNSSLTEEPSSYHCWCGKDISPRNVPGLPPHSCGQTCSKPRATCPHPCSLECHAGPCPPCTLMGPTQSCFCGKHEVTKRCSETDYGNGWSCKEICGDLLPCGEHFCASPCHSGLCGSCEIPVQARCYCGKEHKEIPCDRRGDLQMSFNYGQVSGSDSEVVSEDSWFDGSFDCGATCGRKYDCGLHACEKTCHPQDELSAHCPSSPNVVLTCPCGKTPLDDLLDRPRQSCEDDIPHCKEVCGKALSCGHQCNDTCHIGPCSPCFQKMDVSCRCGRTVSPSLCHQGEISKPMCMRVCQAQLNCGRHKCGEHCCPGEKKAIERQAAKKKHRQQQASDEVEAEHICLRVCGRMLKCGSHQCSQICHSGPCPSCLEAVFEEISCACGRTVLHPPQPCGTRPPECRFDCTRAPPCGHPTVKHNCHTDDVPCPKCPFLVEKACICGKQRMKNRPCWLEETRCGLVCGKKLKCGAIAPILAERNVTALESARMWIFQDPTAPSPAARRANPVSTRARMLATLPISKTFITCDCQHRKKEVKCLATKTNPTPERDALKCDEECLRLQRNQRLAAALNVDPDHSDDHIPYSDTTLKLFRELSHTWAQNQEREFRVFASEPSEKRLRFKPMPSFQRAFLHALAEDFGFDSESQDPEPHRHVSIFKTPRFVSAPKKTLAQCVKIRTDAAKSAAAAAAASSSAATASAPEPFNSILLSAPRFGLTIDEVESAIATHLAAHNNLSFTTSFLPSDEVLIRAIPVTSWGTSPSAVESTLASLKPLVARVVTKEGIAASATLVHADANLNVLRRESTSANGTGGWNAVAGRAAAQRRTVAPKPSTDSRPASGFVSFSKLARKKVVEDSVADDWEAAAEDEE